jgi:rfaE bifunctional protein kinase chain/domain/rfaE bifunctional protein nucleotidyltransferase chain/domain
MSQTKTATPKILPLESLADEIKSLKAAGKKVVQSHGVFDLLHVGHIRHFEQAKKFGDVLVVTLTEDQHVNKGPHRPAFGQDIRAEVIASLDCVDFVAINRWPSAEKTIKLLQPDIYAKGPDYADKSKDITGGISVEADAVASVGGMLRITEDITYSSSNLLNRHMPSFDREVNDFLVQFRQRHSAGDISDAIARLKGMRVLVIGETILDEYVYCNALGKSSKEPILAMHYVSQEKHAGGAVAIANHVAEFSKSVDLLTYLGAEATQEEFVRDSLKDNVTPNFVYKPKSPTLVKRRFVDKYLVQKLFEIYEMNDSAISGKEDDQICDFLEANLEQYDAVVVADFGHGLISNRAVKILGDKARFLAINTQINAANIGFHTVSKYKRADYICIHEGELRLDNRNRSGEIKPLVEDLAKRLDCKTIMVTRGRSGTLLFENPGGYTECPSLAVKVIDRIGAGDAVLSVTSIAAAASIPAEVVGFIGNLAGAQAVTIVGNKSSISRVSMLKSVESLLK